MISILVAIGSRFQLNRIEPPKLIFLNMLLLDLAQFMQSKVEDVPEGQERVDGGTVAFHRIRGGSDAYVLYIFSKEIVNTLLASGQPKSLNLLRIMKRFNILLQNLGLLLSSGSNPLVLAPE